MKRVAFFSFLFFPALALACTPPFETNPDAPPPTSEKITRAKIGETSLAFVPYSLGANAIEYRVWSFDKACKATAVPVEPFARDNTQVEGIECTGIAKEGDGIRCYGRSDSYDTYHYKEAALKIDRPSIIDFSADNGKRRSKPHRTTRSKNR